MLTILTTYNNNNVRLSQCRRCGVLTLMRRATEETILTLLTSRQINDFVSYRLLLVNCSVCSLDGGNDGKRGWRTIWFTKYFIFLFTFYNFTRKTIIEQFFFKLPFYFNVFDLRYTVNEPDRKYNHFLHTAIHSKHIIFIIYIYDQYTCNLYPLQLYGYSGPSLFHALINKKKF